MRNGDRSNNTDTRAANSGQGAPPGAESPGPAAPPTPELVPVDKSDALKGARKLGKKQKKLLKDTHRPLDSWEKYRALTDALDEALELVDLGDHKARFALIIAGALNVFLFALGASTDVFDNIPQAFRMAVATLAGLYAVLAIYVLIQAIESLRPRRAQPYVHYSADTGGYEEYPLGIRFYEDVLGRDMEAYRQAWRDVRIGQLNNEVAVQLHAISAIIRAKYAALDRLYRGLQLMVVFAVVLLLIGTGFIYQSKGERLRLKKNALLGMGGADKTAKEAAKIFGDPQRVADFGVKEPSGVAFHPGLGRIFAVGDEGSLAELDADGKRIDSRAFGGNLEDVAVHTPSGDLLLLSELESALILYDPKARREKKRWQMDAAAVLGQAPEEKNQGFEGLAFRPERGRPGGGVFYLAHQRTPAMIVALSFDPAAPAGALPAGAVVSRWPLRDYEDLTAVAYAPSLDRILVLTDKSDLILVLGKDGAVEAEVPVPGDQQEGLAIDAKGDIWVADDKDKSLLRLPGGLRALAGQVRGGSPAPAAPTPRASA